MAEAKPVTILGVEGFICSQPYDTGHVCTEPEAKVLNQVRKENLGNNFRDRVKAYKDGEEGAATLEELIAAYAEADASYTFTLQTAAASAKLEPWEREQRNLARAALKDALAAHGLKLGTPAEGYTEESWGEYIEQLTSQIIADNPELEKTAKKIVAQRQTTGKLNLGSLAIAGQGEAAPTTE